MWGKSNNNKSTEVQQNKNQVNSDNYSWDAEVIHGNAATGEQVWVNRKVQSATQITYEEMKKNWEEMDKEAGKLQAEHPGQVISAISYQDEIGNQVIRFTPNKELIFPVGVPIYDENGNKIIGLDNIRAEIGKRREEWARWEREGKLEEHVEIHHTNDNKTVRIKFRAAPKRLHPNEIKNETEWFINNATEQWESRLHIKDSQALSEEALKSLTDTSNKKPRTEDRENITSMEVDNKSESYPAEPTVKMLTDDEIEIASKDEIIDLIERLRKELEIREKIEADSSSSFQTSSFSTQELKDKLRKSEKLLNGFQTSSPSYDNKDNKSDNSGKVGIIVAVVGVSALAIGGIALVKSKFSKSKKK